MKKQEKQIFFNLISDLLCSEIVNKMKLYTQHGNVSTYEHSLFVAYYSYFLSLKISKKLDAKSIVRGAFLHDFYLYDWHKNKNNKLHGFSHAKIALKNAEEYFKLNNIEKNIIISHMWPLNITFIPKYSESFIVCLVDKWCAILETLGILTFFIGEAISTKIGSAEKPV